MCSLTHIAMTTNNNTHKKTAFIHSETDSQQRLRNNDAAKLQLRTNQLVQKTTTTKLTRKMATITEQQHKDTNKDKVSKQASHTMLCQLIPPRQDKQHTHFFKHLTALSAPYF